MDILLLSLLLFIITLETHLMWSFKAWEEWRVPKNWSGRQGGWVAGPHLTPKGDARRGLIQAQQGEDQTTCRSALEKLSKPGDECLGQSLAQGGRVGVG